MYCHLSDFFIHLFKFLINTLIICVAALFIVPPTIEGDPNEKYTIIENQTVVLPCSVSGVPPPEVTWRKNFVPFKPESARYLFGDYGMTIVGAKIDDKGIYECIASNVAGDETKVFVLIIQGKIFLLSVSLSLKPVFEF